MLYLISDPISEDFVGTFDEKEMQKTSQKEIKRKLDTLYVKWKGCDDSFTNSEIAQSKVLE